MFPEQPDYVISGRRLDVICGQQDHMILALIHICPGLRMTAGKSLMFECVCQYVCVWKHASVYFRGHVTACTWAWVWMSVSTCVRAWLKSVIDYRLQYRLQISLQATDYSDFRFFTGTESTLTSCPGPPQQGLRSPRTQTQCLGQREPALQMDSSAPAQTSPSGPANFVGGQKRCRTLHMDSMVTSAALSIYKCPSIWVEP